MSDDGSLEQLVHMERYLSDQIKDLKEKHEGVRAQLKDLLYQALQASGQEFISVTVTGGLGVKLSKRYATHFDTKRFRADHPLFAQDYTTQRTEIVLSQFKETGENNGASDA